MHLNGIAKRITALALGAALLTATALPAFAEGTQQINVKYTYNAIDGTTWEKISHADFGTETNDGVVDYLGNGKVGPYVQGASTENNGDRGQSYSYAAETYGDWVYIGTMYGGLGASLILTLGSGNLDPEVTKAAIDVMYNGNMYVGEPDGVSAGGILYKFNVKTGETKILMAQSADDGGTGVINILRGSTKIGDKLYFGVSCTDGASALSRKNTLVSYDRTAGTWQEECSADAKSGEYSGFWPFSLDGQLKLVVLWRGTDTLTLYSIDNGARYEVPYEEAGSDATGNRNFPIALTDDGRILVTDGYIDRSGDLLGWFNELAFAPVDLSETAAVDEWSGDRGVGCKYFSQDAVIKLAPAAGIALDEGLSPAEKLKTVQALAEGGDERAKDIFRTIGAYLAHTVPLYEMTYDIRHLIVLGRVASGVGGELIVGECCRILQEEYPALAQKVQVMLPDEKFRRVGQSMAAASLPEVPDAV